VKLLLSWVRGVCQNERKKGKSKRRAQRTKTTRKESKRKKGQYKKERERINQSKIEDEQRKIEKKTSPLD